MNRLALMSKLRESSGFVAKNGVSVLLRLVAIGFVFFPQRWLNTELSPEVLKDYNVALSVVGVVLGIIRLGIPQILHRVYTHMPPGRGRDVAWSSLMALRAGSFLVGLGLVLLVGVSGLVRWDILVLLYITMFGFLADEGYRAIVDSDNRSWQYSASDLVGKIILNLGLFGAAAYLPVLQGLEPFYRYAVAMGVSVLSVNLLDAWWQRRHYTYVRPSLEYLRSQQRAIVYLGLTGFLVGSFLTTDQVFLARYGYSSEVINGYANAYKLYGVAAVVPGITMPVLASTVIKRLRGLADSEKRASLRRYTLAAMGVGVPITLGMMGLGPWALDLIDPESLYTAVANPALLALAPIVIINFAMVFLANVYVLTGNDKQETVIQVRNLIVALVAYGTLIYYFGYMGAVVSTGIIAVFDVGQRAYGLFAAREKLTLDNH